MSLQQRAASGVKWSTVSQAGRQVMQLATTLVLARLLSPDDFGLASMALVVVGFVLLFKDLGTAAAIIQRRELSPELLSSVFWVNVLFGALASAAIFAAAPLLAAFYREPQVTPLIQALSVSFLLSSLGVLQQALLERDLAFDRLAKAELAAVVAGALGGIGGALAGAGVWSLVVQSILMAGVTSLMLWLSARWRPRLYCSWREIRPLLGYSLNLVGFNTFNYLARNADYLLIGRFLGAAPLGYYTLAYRIMLYPIQNIAAVIGRVVFPVFAQVQDDHGRFRQGYLRVIGMIALVTFPLMLGLLLLSEPLVAALFGPQWAPVATLLMIFAPLGLAQSIGTTVGTIYQAKGRTDLLLYWGVASGLCVVTAVALGLRWGVLGVAGAYAAASFLLAYPSFAIPLRLIDLPTLELGRALWRPCASALVMAAGLLALRLALPAGIAPELVLAILVPAGALIYGLASWVLNREPILLAAHLLRSRV